MEGCRLRAPWMELPLWKAFTTSICKESEIVTACSARERENKRKDHSIYQHIKSKEKGTFYRADKYARVAFWDGVGGGARKKGAEGAYRHIPSPSVKIFTHSRHQYYFFQKNTFCGLGRLERKLRSTFKPPPQVPEPSAPSSRHCSYLSTRPIPAFGFCSDL